jgi:5-methylcytosine-specific restriction enzyme A
MPRAPHQCAAAGCNYLVPAGGPRCPQHRGVGPRKVSTSNASRDRTSTAGHKRRSLKVLQDANWRCQIAREDRCTGRATVYDHRIAVKMLDIIPYASRPTRDELDEPWNVQASCDPCSRWKASMEGHDAAGHNVECPFDLAIIPDRIRNRTTSLPSIPRSIRLSYTDTGASSTAAVCHARRSAAECGGHGRETLAYGTKNRRRKPFRRRFLFGVG